MSQIFVAFNSSWFHGNACRVSEGPSSLWLTATDSLRTETRNTTLKCSSFSKAGNYLVRSVRTEVWCIKLFHCQQMSSCSWKWRDCRLPSQKRGCFTRRTSKRDLEVNFTSLALDSRCISMNATFFLSCSVFPRGASQSRTHLSFSCTQPNCCFFSSNIKSLFCTSLMMSTLSSGTRGRSRINTWQTMWRIHQGDWVSIQTTLRYTLHLE